MDIEYDTTKDASNRAKHGLSLIHAADLFDAPYFEVEDTRFEYGERRFIAIGVVMGRVHVCVYVWRGPCRRIVSLRRANRREENAYRQAEQG